MWCGGRSGPCDGGCERGVLVWCEEGGVDHVMVGVREV